MIFRRLIAFPESNRILVMHLAATPFLAVQTGVYMMIPVLLRKQFGAAAWQVTIATSALAIMYILAIFWNEVYARLRARSFLLLLFGLSVLPLGAVALCSRPGAVLVAVMISAAGMGGINCMTADLLRSCYPPVARNRVFSVIKVIEQFTIMVATLAVGRWLDSNNLAYRIYFPGAVIVIGIGLWLVWRMSEQRLFQERHRARSDLSLPASLRAAYGNMVRALRGDDFFRRYETAFCTYGFGWMICYALLPLIVVDILRLTYGQAAWATQSSYQLILLIMMVPTSYWMDRLGAIRLSGWCFLGLVVYPLGLMLAFDTWSLTAVFLLYGIGMAGVNLSWTLGPVSLARDASKAPQYLAIHATLTSVRAILGQFPAVALYAWTGSICLPLAVAGGMFVAGGVLMFRLDRDWRRAGGADVERASAPIEPLEPEPAVAGP